MNNSKINWTSPGKRFLTVAFVTLCFATTSYAAGQIDYILTTPTDPALPGQTVEFDATVHNLTNSSQAVRLDWTVPKFTTENGNSAGSNFHYDFGTLTAGKAATVRIYLDVNGATSVPPGSVIKLVVKDLARSASVSRNVIVRHVPTLGVALSTEEGTVAPGADFTYTVAASNVSGGSVGGAVLTVDVPAGATFVSADANGTAANGVVTWQLNGLPAGANRQVHVTFNAGTGTPPLGPIEAKLKDAGGHLARASDTRMIVSAPTFDYTLTAVQDPARPDQTVEFDVTVHNLTNASQSVRLDWTVPWYTTENGNSAGSAFNRDFGTVAPGKSVTSRIYLDVWSSGDAREGGSITLNVFDLARSASVSRTVVVRDVPALGVDLSTEDGTVAPGTDFTYTVAASNISGGSVSGVTLTVPVPAGATFVSADAGGAASGGVVTWPLNVMPAGGNRQVHVTFKAGNGTPPVGAIDATLRDAAGHVARTSDSRVLVAAPTFDYILTAVQDPARPDQTVEFDVTVHNLTNASQAVRLDWTVPWFTTENGNSAGSAFNRDFGTVAPGKSVTSRIYLDLENSDNAPDGGSVTLQLWDLARSASVSRTAVVRDLPALAVDLSTEDGTVAPGSNFTYAATVSNISGGGLSGAVLTMPVPVGATFVGADSGGTASNRVVTWPLNGMPAGGNRQVHVTFKAGNGTPPLGAVTATLRDAAGHVARTSDSRVLVAAPTFDYILTAVQDPARPDQTVEFDVTVHNLTNASQAVRLDWTVPWFTTENGNSAGSAFNRDFGTVAPGKSVTSRIYLDLKNSDNAPDGGSVTLQVWDLARAASVSRTVVVRDLPALGIDLSTQDGTVAPGSNFTYTIAASNISGGGLSGAVLAVPVPTGATFVSATDGGAANGGLVKWPLNTLAAGANRQVQVTFKAGTGSPPLGAINAIVKDSDGHVARTSDSRVLISAPVFEYSVVAVQDPAAPGETVEFDVTVHNLTNASQPVRLDWTVPWFTNESGNGPGSTFNHDFGTMSANQLLTFKVFLDVWSAPDAPDGASVTLDLWDLARAASVSKTIVVRTP